MLIRGVFIPVLPSTRAGRSGRKDSATDFDPFSAPGRRATPEIPRMLFLRNSRRFLCPIY
jgi:hypothetical protein